MKTDRSHDEIEELIAADALDGLGQGERDRLFREMASHGPDCPDCARLLSEYSEVAGWLAMALEPTALSRGAEERLIQAAREDAVPERPAAPAIGRWRRWAAAASVAAVLAAIGGAVGWAIAPKGQGTSPDLIAFVAKPGSIGTVTLAAGRGRTLAVAIRPGEREAWVVGTGLPDPGGGKVYELWYRRRSTGRMEPAGTFTPKDGTVVAKVDVGDHAFNALAVSVEPPGGSEQPTTNPIYLVSV